MTATPRKITGNTITPGTQSAMPVLLFLVVNRLAGLRWAVLAATIWSVKIVVERRRAGIPLGVFMPIVTAAVVLRGAIGVITGSETVYFGLGIASKYAIAAVLAASVLLRKPLANRAEPFLLGLEPHYYAHRRYINAMYGITAVAATYYVLSASMDVWLWQRSSVEGFVLLRFLANWPLSVAALAAAGYIAHAQLSKIEGITSLPALIEARMDALNPPKQP